MLYEPDRHAKNAALMWAKFVIARRRKTTVPQVEGMLDRGDPTIQQEYNTLLKEYWKKELH